jgi:nicotinate-nucleotide adenylyltransferase
MWNIARELNTIDPRRIGLLGGTFDPIHLGHLQIAQDALEARGLDEVCLIPCASPPHKQAERITTGEQRLAMIETAIADDPRLSVSLVELERGGTSYTVDTLRELQAGTPAIEFFFVIGADTLFELYSWKEIDKLIEIVVFVVVARPGFDTRGLTAERLRLGQAQFEILANSIIVGHETDISSTEVRARVAEGLSAKYLVPDRVAAYIAGHGLYKSM